jgi:hypothetical protein
VVRGYVDDDEIGSYPVGWGPTWASGPRVGPVAAMNKLVELNPDYDLYGMVPDDAVMETPGWDQRMAEVAARFEGGVGVVSPAHNLGDHDDMPFVTKRWVEALGWFAYPGVYHWAWPTVISALGEGIQAIVRPKDVVIRHDHAAPSNQEMSREDAKQFYAFMAYRYPTALRVLRDACGTR